MQRALTYSLLFIGVLTGIFHLRFAAEGWFISRNDEPLSFWIFLISGPLSTLPAVIISFFWRKIGGTWLICGSLLSLLAWIVAIGAKRDLEHFMSIFLSYTVPMLVLGLVALLRDYFKPVAKDH